jgi:transmembrane sensor
LVRLHGGEAHFSVQPDAARPFVVAAGHGTATAVGTAFNVKIAAARAEVAVTQGIVDVRAGASEAVRLRRGEAISFGASGAGDVTRVEPADVTAWQRDRLVFHNAPLGQVLDDLDRYRVGRIVVMDGEVARLPVTGVFDTRRTDAALETMTRTLPIRLVRVSDYLVLVYRAAPG